METVSKDLRTEIETGRTKFENETFSVYEDALYYIESYLGNNRELRFTNCVFKGVINIHDLNKPDFSLVFHLCSFESDVTISHCTLKTLQFSHLKEITNITIYSGIFDLMTVYSGKFILKGNVTIFSSISKSLNFSNLHIGEGEFSLQLNKSDSEVNASYQFINSSFYNSNMSYISNGFSSFRNFKVLNSCFIDSCDFQKTSFQNADFGKASHFRNCTFNDYVGFENCTASQDSMISFTECLFVGVPHFNNSKFDRFEITHSTFENKASFDQLEVVTIKLYQVIFSGAVFFDDINIRRIKDCDRTTIRIIKRELVNSHNQIDYLRFKAYELNSYKREVDKNKLNWRDSIILYFNKESNYFGLDWTKGMSFIFNWSFVFYCLYVSSYFAAIDSVENSTSASLLTNYLKFTNPISIIETPLPNSENYFFPFLFLILGKIFVSFGIYQTVQAFRKFGVNGG